jgi:hypothetical protein
LADTHKVPGLLLAIAFRLRQDGIGWSNRNCSMTHAEPRDGENFEEEAGFPSLLPHSVPQD